MKLSGLFALLVLGVASLAAQAAPDTTRLPDRAVTAVKVDVATGVAPAATTILYGDDLRARGVLLVTDALREVPGVMIVPNASYGSITSIFLRGGESDYVKVLLDGIPLNIPGGSIDLANLTLENIERIEVVRGPTSVLHGTDAVSGVIQLFTKKGKARATSDITLSRGTYDNSIMQLAMSGKPKNVFYSFSGGQFKSDGTYPFNNQYRNRDVSLQLGSDGPDGERLAFTARYDDALAHYPTDYTGVAVDSNQFDRTHTLALGLDFARPLSDYTRFTARVFGSRQRRESTNRPDSPGDSTGFGFEADRGSLTWRRGTDVRVDLARSSGARTSFGVAYEQETEEQTSRSISNYGTGAFEEFGDFDADRNTVSAYSQLYATPTPFVTVQLGARIDHNSAFGDFVTWRGGISLLRRSGWRGWIAAGNAFKAPTFSELFAASAYEIGNPDLDPERSTSLEAGIGWAMPNARGLIALTAFSQRFRDLIQFVGAGPGGSNYVNLGGADARGLEAAVDYKLTTRLSTRATWSWLRTEVTDTGSASSQTFALGEALLRRPAQSGSLALTWRTAAGASLSGVVSFIGSRDDVDYRPYPTVRTTLPSYQTVDLSLLLPIRRLNTRESGIDLMLRGENLFDAEYEQVVAFPGRGRTLFAGVRLHQ